MKVSVVTPNYNGERFLKAFFDSLNNDSECIGEVIIVDNGSTDGSKEFIKGGSFNFPVNLIENTENLGFSPAVNQGIENAKYEYVFSLNNDTEIREGSIKALVELISSADDIFSVPQRGHDLIRHGIERLQRLGQAGAVFLPIAVCIYPDYLVDRIKLDRLQPQLVHVALKRHIDTAELLRIEHLPGKVKQVALGHQADAVAVEPVQESLSARIQLILRIALIEAEDAIRNPFQLIQAA